MKVKVFNPWRIGNSYHILEVIMEKKKLLVIGWNICPRSFKSNLLIHTLEKEKTNRKKNKLATP